MGWSDGGAANPRAFEAAISKTLTANYKTQYRLTVEQANMNRACGGNIVTNPPSADGYYDSGTAVTLTVEPNAVWFFAGWEGAAMGANPTIAVTMDGSKTVRALFNTAGAPLAVTSLTPASAPVNGAAFTLTMNGTGFTAGTNYTIQSAGGATGADNVAQVSPTQITIPITAAQLTQPQNLTITLLTSPNWASGCLVRLPIVLPVRAATDTNRLGPGGELLPNNETFSPNRVYRIQYQKDDGNLVLYRVADNFPIRASDTTGRTPAGRVVMDPSGKLVIQQAGTNNELWTSATQSPENANSVLVLEDTGKLVIYNPQGRAIWTNGVGRSPCQCSSGPVQAGPRRDTVARRFAVHGEPHLPALVSGDGRKPGAFRPTGAIWASGTGGRPLRRLLMQKEDGHLVMYAPGRHLVYRHQQS